MVFNIAPSSNIVFQVIELLQMNDQKQIEMEPREISLLYGQLICYFLFGLMLHYYVRDLNLV